MASNGRPVCIVDDNVDNATGLAMLIETLGFEVKVAHDGVSGLALIDRVKPFVAIVDIGLPGISGYDIARKVRASQGGTIRLVALTGWGQHKDVSTAIAAGFDAHFTKPADPAELMSLVDTFATQLAAS